MCHIYLGLLAWAHPFHSPIHHCLQTESVVASEQTHQASLSEIARIRWIIPHSTFFFFFRIPAKKWRKEDGASLKNFQAMKKRKQGYESTSGTKAVNKVTGGGLFTEQSSSVPRAERQGVLKSRSQRTRLREMSETVSSFFFRTAIWPRVLAHILVPI